MSASSAPRQVDVVAAAQDSLRPQRSGWRRFATVLRIVVPIGLLGYLLTLVEPADVWKAMTSVSGTALGSVALMALLGNAVASVRWRLVMRAVGIDRPVSLLQLFRLSWIGGFYNMCVPGGVGGDVVRAVATRTLFGSRGFPGALGVVFLDRVLGLIGLLLLVAGSFALAPLPQVPNVMLFSALGLTAALGAIVVLVQAPRLAPLLPTPIGAQLARLPRLSRRWLLLPGSALSILTQLTGVVTGHLVLSSITGQVQVAQSIVIMPLVLASQYFPLSVGGAGVREAAFVWLYGMVGVAAKDALAASLVVAALQYVLAVPGGVAQMLWPLQVEPDAVAGEAQA